MLGLAFCILLVILFAMSASISLYKRETIEFILSVIVIYALIYTTLITIKSVF